jgi:hypothetical protein
MLFLADIPEYKLHCLTILNSYFGGLKAVVDHTDLDRP